MTRERGSDVRLAEGLSRQGHLAPAVEACHRALLARPTDPLPHVLMAELMLSLDCHDEAVAAATQAIELDPDCAPAYLTLGLAYDRRGGMWDQSVLVWHELAEVVPDLVLAHVQLGEAFAAANFEDEAIDAWRAALALDPKHPRAMYDLGVAALKREGMATALPGFRKAGELDPSQDELFFHLAEIGPVPVELPDIATVPADRGSRLAVAGMLARTEDLFGAADLVRAVLDADAEDGDALALAAYVYLKQEAVNEAMACAMRALSLRNDLATATYCLGVAYARRPGLARHTVRVFRALANAVPAHPMPHVLLGEALLGVQRYAAARESYERALRLDPACVRARFGLAAVLLTEGRWSESSWHVRRAAYHDTRRNREFWKLFDRYVEGEA